MKENFDPLYTAIEMLPSIAPQNRAWGGDQHSFEGMVFATAKPNYLNSPVGEAQDAYIEDFKESFKQLIAFLNNVEFLGLTQCEGKENIFTNRDGIHITVSENRRYYNLSKGELRSEKKPITSNLEDELIKFKDQLVIL